MLPNISCKLKKPLLPLLCVLFCLPPGRAQEQKDIKSLLGEYANSKGKAKVELANRFLGIMHKEEFTETPIRFSAKSNPDSIDLGVWYWAGEYLYDIQEYDSALAYTLRALPLFKDNIEKADCQSLVSIIYFRKSCYTEALAYARQCLKTYRKSNDHSRISSALNTIAGIYLASKQPAEGEKYILEAIRHSIAAGDSGRIAIQCGMASELYHSMDKDPEALDYAKRALEIDRRLGNTNKVGIRLSQISTVLISQGKYSEAEQYLKRAIPILKKGGMQTSLAICYNQLGGILNMRKDYAKAAGYFEEALSIFTSKKDLYNESKSRFGLYEAFKKSDSPKALTHLLAYAQLKDTLYQKEMQEALGQYNAKYKNDELKMQNEKEKSEKRVILATALSVTFVLLSVLCVLFYVFNLRRKHNKMQQELLETKERFFTNITHEFRTPLTVIHSAAQDIMKHSAENSETYSEASDIIHHERRLLNLINQILDIAKMSSGHSLSNAKWTRDDIAAYLRIICESMAAYSAQKNIRILFQNKESRPSIEADFIPDYIQKVMQNLISNAVKFSPSGSEIIVSVKREDENVVISVSDKGQGMTPEQKANIFKPFYQAADDGKNIGTGIGLSLAKFAMDAMNGSISVKSGPGKGSTFTVSMPTRSNTANATAKDGAATPQTMPELCDFETPVGLQDSEAGPDDNIPRILIAEDVPEVARYMMRQLNPEYCFYYATRGDDAFTKATQIIPDLIISDIMMPGTDGFELCRKIRNSELLSHIPVIMVTAKITQADRLKGIGAGADAYLEKPFHAEELSLWVEKLLEQRRALREKFSKSLEQGKEPDIPELSENDRIFIDKFTKALHESMQKGKADYDTLAYKMCLSRAQLNRKIKAISGYTTTEYIQLIRIAAAKKLLDTTDMPVWEVAMKCGIDDAAYFGSLFKKVTGVTPTQYKRRNA